jgi:2-dehydro-3-deoxygluconokinase
MIELYQQEDRMLKMGFAGDSLNTSTYLARLAAFTQTQVHYITLLGTDPYSEMMLAHWRRENIHTAYIEQLPDKLPGLYLIQTNAEGERTFYFYRSQSAARELFYPQHTARMEAVFAQMDILYLSNITLAILTTEKYQRLYTLLKQAKEQGKSIIFDTNYRPSLWPTVGIARGAVQEIMPLIDTALVTLDDEKKLFNDESPEQCAERLHRFGAREVVVKCGASPCLVSVEGDYQWVPAEKIDRVVDTTSAGDAFNAGYLAARWQGHSPASAARYGHQLAGRVIQCPGAIIPMEAMPELFVASG